MKIKLLMTVAATVLASNAEAQGMFGLFGGAQPQKTAGPVDTGAATDAMTAYLARKPEALRPLYKALYTGGERNAVLNFQRLGLSAMDQGYWSDAEAAFDGALTRIESIYANNKQAEAARSTFHNESNKDFKGEPYERAMAFYYRGLLYLRAGDYDNARASFKQAEYQDTVSEVETFQNDFAVMNYLKGWTYHCQGDSSSAAEAFAEAQKAAPALVAPKDTDTVLFIAELGRGPVKARAGKSNQKLVFNAATADAITGASYDIGAPTPLQTVEASSVYFQASTRGGRAIDGILQGKANFKETTQGMGETAMQLGVAAMAGGDMDTGLGFGGAGMLFSILGSAAKTQADIRGWDTLPDRILVATAPAPATATSAKVQYWAGGTAQGGAAVPTMSANAAKCGIAWSRASSSAGVSPDVPGEDMGVAAAVARKSQNVAKNRAFRAALEAASNATAVATAAGTGQ